MTIRYGFVCACALLAVGFVRAQTPVPQSQPTFATSTDVVMVDVSVRKNGKQVTGLTARDFDLRDNGVKQDVEAVESQAVPIDLSILIDVSGNPDRPWVDLPSESEVAGKVVDRARKLTRLLRPGDRVRLFALSTYIQQVWALQSADKVPAVPRVDFDGMPSLFDSLITLSLQPVEPNRRHVIVAETKGLDAVSVAAAADVQQVLGRSDAQTHLVMMERQADEELTVPLFQCRFMDLCRPTYRFSVPARRRLFAASPIAANSAPEHPLTMDGRALKEGAEATGGGLYQTEGLAEPTLLNTFEKAFENFRQSYILRYTPKGVARTGWHDITVTVPRDKSVQIKARNGYSIDAPAAPPPTRSPLPTGSALLKTVADVTNAFDQSAFDLVRRSLRQIPDAARFIAEFEAAGNPWPASPRREATLALEVAEAALFSNQATARDQGAAMLQRFAYLVRDPITPDLFEREWLVAASRMLQGLMRPATSERFVDAAIQRFPDDPRLRMARAIITDQRWPMSGSVRDLPEVTRAFASPTHVATMTEHFEMAGRSADFRAESTLRRGWFLHRIGSSADALALIAPVVVDPADRALVYLKDLLMGHVLEALDRNAEALAAFRRAAALAPRAQAARVAVMNALLLTGDRDQAAALATELQSTPVTMIDPWWLYWQGDYRRYPESLARLRELMR